MIDKFISIFQIILPLFLLLKTIFIPYINKRIKIKGSKTFDNETEVRKYIHKKRNETNELHITTFFLYFMLFLSLNWFKVLNFFENSGDSLIENTLSYIGSIIEIGFLVILQLHLYKYSLSQKPDLGKSISKISKYKNNSNKLVQNVYIFLIIEVFLQALIVGLIPFFQIDRFFYVDIIVLISTIVALIHILYDQFIIHEYNHQKFYLKTWTIFIFVTIFSNLSSALLIKFESFLNIPLDSNSILLWLLLKTIWSISSLTQIICLFINIIQKSSIEEWYND